MSLPHKTAPSLLLPAQFQVTCLRSKRSLNKDAFEAAAALRCTQIRAQIPTGAQRVVIAIADPISCLVTLFAVWQCNACAVMVNPEIKAQERANVLQSTGASLWVTEDQITQHETGASHSDDLADAALILMTSGTTGVPKGVTLSIAGLNARLAANVAEIGAATLRNTLCTLPLFFGHGLIGNALSAMFAGQHLMLLPKMTLQEMAAFGQTLDAQNVSFFSSVPSFWRMILSVSAPPKSPVARIHVGSAPLSQQLWGEIAAWCGTGQVFNTYGMTETANWIAGGAFTDPHCADGYVGRAWGGQMRVIRDGALHDTGDGEIAVQSPGQMLGFWRAPDKTQSEMLDGYLRTGDLGRIDVNGTLTLIGRSKNEINVGGIKVLAEEVDMLLEGHPHVAEACSFGIPDKIAGERVGAVVRLSSKDVDSAAILAWCRETARPDAVPAKLTILDEIPKNDRGKIARIDIQDRMIKEWL